MKSEIKSFRNLIVWQKATALAVMLYQFTDDFPKTEIYGLVSQMRRAVISISSNIAEGFKRNSKKEKVQFYTMAYGSLSELESQIEVSFRLKYLTIEQYNHILSTINETSRLLDGLIRSTDKQHLGRFNTSMLVVSIFYILYSIFPTLPARAGNVGPVQIFFIPENSDVRAGDIMKSDIWIDTQGNNINAIDLTLSYNSQVEILSVEKNNSFLNLWVSEPNFSDATRKIKFAGGKTGGWQGKGVIGQLYWRSESAGEKAIFGFDSSSAVLLNDGQGTKVDIETRESSYNILVKDEDAVTLSSASHPDENKWYNQPFVRLQWPTIEGTLYSYMVTKDPAEMPDDIADEPVGSIKLKELKDGTYYFKLKEKKINEEWSSVTSRQIKVDVTPPSFVGVEMARDPELLQNQYFVSFSATDETSGVARYEIIEGDKPAEMILQPPYILKNQNRDKPVIVRAIDAAGNFQDKVIPALPWWQRIINNLKLIIILTGSIMIVIAGIILVWFKKFTTK